jgi:glycosyl hydrolase family 59 (putative galactocerebrosidase)
MIRNTLTAIALTGALMTTPGAADSIRFRGETSGGPTADFEFARTGQGQPARWVIVRDTTVDDGYVLEQASPDPTDYRFPLAIYKPLSGKNVDVQVRFKAVAGRIDRAAGIAVRLTSPNDYYIVRANALEDNVRFYRMVAGKREQLATANINVASNEWHTLGLKAEGERFTISFNGKELYTVTDKIFGAAGRVALWTKADSVTRFDRLDINVLP